MYGVRKNVHVNGSGDSAPAPYVLPQGRIDRENCRPPEERQQSREEQHHEVGQEPRPGRDGGTVRWDARFEVEEAEDEEDGKADCRMP